ncbi:MAG: hypothetical protein ACJ8D7_24150 [Xanthobacteraceae bacterium]
MTTDWNVLRVSQRVSERQGFRRLRRVRPLIARLHVTGANPKESAMKLTPAQVQRILSQVEAKAIPDDHPGVPQLYELFGDHTFFLDRKGLNIVEPAEATQAGVQLGRIVNLANWSDAKLTKLATHEPEPTDAIVEFGSTH